MENGRWNRVEDLFHQAAEIAPAGRPEFLDRVCGDDEELRGEVESLLAADARPHNLVPAAVAQAIQDLPSDAQRVPARQLANTRPS